MQVYKYKDYDHYVGCQKAAFKKKFKNVWAIEKNIQFLAEYIKNKITVENGLCHGTRQGFEQKWFMQYIKHCFIIGSDIGDASEDIFSVQWDFNKENTEWIGKFDFIYSNSFDHAFSPAETLKIWSEQLKPGGLIILEYDRRQEHTGEVSMAANKTDPVSITLKELVEKIPEWVPGSKIIDVLDMPVVTQEWRKSIVVQVP